MPNDYVGRYGDALRRLTTLNRGGLSQSPAPAQPAGAFGGVPPQGPAPQTGAFSAGPAPGITAPKTDPDAPPLTASQLWKDMPDQFKGQIEKQIADSGMNVDQTYAAKVEEGEIEPPKKAPTLQEKLGYLAEVALRTMSNLSRPGTQGFSDFADAKLATDARRGAIETAETDRVRKQAETRRLEGRQDASEQHRMASDMTERELTREAVAAEGAANRRNALDIAGMQERSRSADRTAASKTPGPVIVDQETGDAYQRNADGTITPLQKDVKEQVRGHRGAKPWERTVKKPLKGPLQQGFNGLDADTLKRAVTAAAGDINDDGTQMREIRALLKEGKIKSVDQEILRRAELRAGVPSTGKKPSNFFDETE